MILLERIQDFSKFLLLSSSVHSTTEKPPSILRPFPGNSPQKQIQITFDFKGMGTRNELYKSLELDAYESGCTSNIPRVVQNLSSVLERWIQRNEKHRRSTKRESISMFHGTKAPNMSVRQYMERIYKYARCSPCCFVIAQIYMDRYFERKGGHLCSLNVHRLLITTIVVAAKFVDDGCYSNGHYGRVGGVSTAEMNRMELELIFSLDFRLFVTTELFCSYWERLHQPLPVLQH